VSADLFEAVDEGLAIVVFEVGEDFVDVFAVEGLDFVDEGGAGVGEVNVVDASVAGDGAACDELFVFEFVEDGGDAGTGDDESAAEVGLGEVALFVFEDEENVELRLGELEAAEEFHDALREEVARAHDAEDGFVPNILDGPVEL
jgi:hypothetical protein